MAKITFRTDWKAAAQRLGLVLFVVLIICAAGLIIIFDRPPSPNGPQCAPGEVRLLVERVWWCVPARKAS